MKKQLTSVLVMVCVLSLSIACGSGGTSGSGDNAGQNTSPTSGIASNSTLIYYNISDYYNTDGTFSARGGALPTDPVNGDRVLNVKSGDAIGVGNRQYKVTAEALTLYFYTQSSYNDVVTWWIEYMNSAQERGQVAELK